MNENQALHLWTEIGEKLEFSELSERFKKYFPQEDVVTCIGYLQSARLTRSEMGQHFVTKKGWKARGKTPHPPLPDSPEAGDNALPSPPDEGLSAPPSPSPSPFKTEIVVSKKSIDPETEILDQGNHESSWALFRKLIGYYLDCAHCDERPSNILWPDKIDDTFIPFMTHGKWWPSELSQDVRLNIPVREGQNSFVRRVLLGKEDFFVGYPLHLLGSGDRQIVIPIFCVPVSKINYSENVLDVALDFENADINSSWLEKRFKTNNEKQQFLKLCGLVDQTDEDDIIHDPQEDVVIPENLGLNISSGVDALNIFCESHLSGTLSPMVTDPLVSFTNRDNGIINSAILFSGQKLKFNAGLIKELKKIRGAPDSDLNKTALKHVFLPKNDDTPEKDDISLVSELTKSPVIPFVPFNYEQEEAIKTSLANDLTVITGPPGTGKTQVVVNLLANLATHGKTALFASKNHKAIDAVVPRTNDLVEKQNLVARLKNPETGDLFTWKSAINNIMATAELPYDESSEELRNDIFRKLKRRDQLLEEAEIWSSAERSLSELNEQLEDASVGIPTFNIQSAVRGDLLVPTGKIRSLEREIKAIPTSGSTIVHKLAAYLWRMLRRRRLAKQLDSIQVSLEHYKLNNEFSDNLIIAKEDLKKVCGILTKFNLMHQLGAQISAAENIAREVKPLSSSLEEIRGLLDAVSGVTKEMLSKSVNNRFAGVESHSLQELQQMRGILNNMDAAGVGGQARINWERFFENSFSNLLRYFPIWAVPNLSVRHGLPLIAGVVDMVIIDEASQCDIVSVIPLLFRAKSAVVVGDPQQLKPVHRMSKGLNVQLMRRHGLMDEEMIFPYSYLDSSFFHLAAGTPKCGGKTQLRDHYRCHPDIAIYFNDQFYGKTLRVLTNQANLKIPSGYSAGLIWTDIVGEAKKVSSRGSICRQEIEAIVNEVKSLLVDRHFSGSIGVVAPFRIQADRIRDAVYSAVPPNLLDAAGFACSTADGFQGDERDVILMSCVYQPGLYKGGIWYLTNTETRNLWNVAVSRARAALHIFGNKEFCKQSDAAHLAALARSCDAQEVQTVPTGQFDSIWERKFHDALQDEGIHTVSQYPLAGKRLDLAVPSVRLDIEVDGEKYHKDLSGRRKAEDLWRDMTVQAAGWTPLRFWVYELREDMDSCVATVRSKIDELSCPAL